MSDAPYPWSPVAERLAYLASTGRPVSVKTLVERSGVTRRTIQRYRTNGLTDAGADRIACALGIHPALLWPDWWLTGDDPRGWSPKDRRRAQWRRYGAGKRKADRERVA